MVNAELRRRARNCVTDIGTYIMIECALMLGMVLSVHCGYMNSLYVFCPAMAVVAVLIWNRHREFYKIHAFFRWRREQEMEWG